MSTRSLVSERCLSVVLRLVSSRPVWSSPLPQPTSPLKSSPSKCTTNSSSRVFQVTTSASTPRSSFLTTLVKLVLATLLSWIATLPTLPASSPSSSRRSTVVPASPLRTTPSSSSPVMLPSSRWFPASLCVLRPSPTTHLLVVSPSVTCVKQWQ